MKNKGDSISLISVIFIMSAIMAITGCASTPPLHDAALKGDVITVKELLDKGANIDAGVPFAPDMTPLMYAAYKGQLEVVKLLVERGANVNAIYNPGGVSRTPLAFAAQNGHKEIVKYLVDKGADIDRTIFALRKATNSFAKKDNEISMEFLQGFKREMDESTQKKGVKTAAIDKVSPAIKSDVDESPAIMSEPRKNAYAVVIGIENYRSLPKSDYSRNDAALVKAYLKSLGFQERNIDFITDETATKTDIEKSLEAWLPNRATKDSLIIVYFSGHGAPEPSTGEAYIVPYDGDPNYLPVTGYPLKRLYERLGKLEAKEIVVVLDSCFSGSGGRSVLAKGARPLVMMADTRIPSSNIAVLTATQGSQISTSSPEKGHGIFTYYFIKAIKDGKRNLAEIYEYIKPQVEDEAKQLNIQQSPSLNPGVEKVKGRFSLRK